MTAIRVGLGSDNGTDGPIVLELEFTEDALVNCDLTLDEARMLHHRLSIAIEKLAARREAEGT